MDHALISKVKDVQSFIDFKGKTPKRCLDLGTAVCCVAQYPSLLVNVL